MADRRVLANLQVCRALAALFVVYGHSLHDLETISTRAGLDPVRTSVNWGAGVDIFFVISGFIMVHVAAREFGEPGAPQRFFVRRVARIAPMYWLLTTVLILGALVAPEMLNVPIGGLSHILKSYVFIPDWRPDMSAVRPVMALGWTLNYEMFFYVVFAVAMLAPLRVGVAGMSVFFVALAILGSTLTIPQTQLAFWTDPITLEFLFGVYVGLAHRAGLRLSGPVAIALASAGLLLIGANLPERLGLTLDFNALRFGLPAALFIAAAALGPEISDSAAKKFMVALGDSSYALYLCHPFVIRPLREIWLKIGGADAPLFLFSLACLIGSTALAFALHYGVEDRIARALAPLVRRLGPPRLEAAPPARELVVDRPPATAANADRALRRGAPLKRRKIRRARTPMSRPTPREPGRSARRRVACARSRIAQQACGRLEAGDREPHRRHRRLRVRRRVWAVKRGDRRRRQRLDDRALAQPTEAAVDLPRFGGEEARKENLRLGGLRVLQDEARETPRAVGMDLRLRVPEVFWKMLLADEKPRLGHRRAGGEGERKRHPDLAAVGPRRAAREIEALEIAEPGVAELEPVGLGVVRAQDQHRDALAALERLCDEAREGEDAGRRRRRLEAPAQPDQFEERAVELDDVVLGAPGMAIACAHLKAEAAIELGLRREIASGDDEMVDGAGHGRSSVGGGDFARRLC